MLRGRVQIKDSRVPMMNMKRKVIIVLAAVLVTRYVTAWFGPLDTYPRLQQAALSPDGACQFEIYRSKVSPLNPLADVEIVFRITDLRRGTVSEINRGRSAWWIDKGKKYDVRFESRWVILNNFWVIDKSGLKVRMCPRLECLQEAE